MSKARRDAWLYLAVGLFWLFIAARDIWAPAFLSISRHPEGDSMLEATVAGLLLVSARRQFKLMRRAVR